jgi:hypothetical protein
MPISKHAKLSWEYSMNVLWKRTRQATQNGKARHLLEAILVEIDRGGGEPREGVVTHLGSIEERFLKTKVLGMRAFYRGLFWKVADQRLDDLKLEEDIRKGIESTLAETVPRPSDDWGLWAVTCIPRFEK